MTVERRSGPTPAGGAYVLLTYVRQDPLHEVDKADADTVIITEYRADGTWLKETVGSFTPPADAKPVHPLLPPPPLWPTRR